MNENKNIDSLFKKLETRHINPSEQAWKKIEQKLTEKSKRKYIWIRISTAAACLFCVTGTYHMLHNTKSKIPMESVKQNIKQEYITSTSDRKEILTTIVQEKSQKNNPEPLKKAKQPAFTKIEEESRNIIYQDTAMKYQPTNSVVINKTEAPQAESVEKEAERLLEYASNQIRQRKVENLLLQTKASILREEAEKEIGEEKITSPNFYVPVAKYCYQRVKSLLILE